MVKTTHASHNRRQSVQVDGLNARRRLGVRRHRHGVDQQVLVDIMTPLSLVIWFALI